MTISKEKKDLTGIVMGFALLFLALIALHLILTLQLWLPHSDSLLYQPLFSMYHKLNSKMIFIRGAYILGIFAVSWFTPSIKIGKNVKDADVKYYLIFIIVLSVLILLGPINVYHYDLIAFPVFLIAIVYPSALYFSKTKGNLKEEEMLNDVSSLAEGEMTFSFNTNKGNLVVHSPQQGVWIEGGAGSGKSASLIEPYIHQAVEKDFAGVIYDFKGNPPTLALTAFNSLVYKKQGAVKFAMLNFSLLKQSIRCNPIAPRYLPDDRYAAEAADIIMKNLQKDWIKKTDFWADNAISILKASIWMLRVHYPQYCTLPHAISLVLNDYKLVLDFLASDPEVKRLVLPVIVAHENDAQGQIAGAIASVQLPLTKLMNKQLFWVLSEDGFDLDITNKENPKMFCICNDPALKETLSPAISLILSVCMQQMNQQGKTKSIFCIDELPTIYIKNLDVLPATARSNKVCTILACQDYSQLEDEYGKDKAKVVISNLGNQFTGMTNNTDTAERISKSLGKLEKKATSYSTSESSLSESESLKEKSVLQAREIAGQDIGHFTGKIAGGKPPFFSAQFPYFDKDKIYKPYLNKIPDFALTAITGDKDLDDKIFNEQVEANFHRINKEVNEMLMKHLHLK